ncbi:adenine deaminase [Peribacillus psychrosaccharolyticus]|uniref:adenine deaminase n=1 Tax=Peribacillus psychrosaccharolyticus TaxID=1407 RepID=A0A974NIS0_PERPY|nr:adenine deaminase C-terminal domain-containing protein [Peribacillus psychrosaccharolyticus]MEC2056914.1 adenine deaminase C-terminal domain-containing protein [Peribacillus psychrosaccharolyticus]MED3744836.1 adenine deaminase C-terminal domain-containing protein [Peribacillus psychrosaccharolyticus]QQS98533.1 adenine deaminase [Peribacillus psychrosaccharolyticus]
MLEQRYRWKNKDLREHVEVLDGSKAPTILLHNAVYLNQYLRKWTKANIWIYDDRIVYVGEKYPDDVEGCEVINCEGRFLVPGYIEPHAHPFQLYNPLTLSQYTSKYGTTTLLNDNLMLFLQLDKKKAFSLLKELRTIPATMYWWCRFDGQTELLDEELIFTHGEVKAWLEHDAVLQGGELTGWPRLLDGDDMMLHWIQETKRMRKKIEGHFPGASEKTLAKLMLFGADCDHEAMSGEEVMNRLMQGYTVALRHSSIRPDLPKLLKEIQELGINQFDKFFYTTDGSPPSFHEEGYTDQLIKIAIDSGVPVIDAYNMATINIARYYNMEYLHGNIATGRVANINFLSNEKNPTPVSVLAKGQWVKREGECLPSKTTINWKDFQLEPLELEWDIDAARDFEFSMPFGIEMVNDVILKPYSVVTDVSFDELSYKDDQCFFVMIDRGGKWRINTIIKGFANKLSGFCSSFSNTGDIVMIGKSKKDMVLAFNRMKELGGGIVLAENGKISYEMELPLNGIMSTKSVETLIKEELELKTLLEQKGYRFNDPIYTLLFFSATHLPYIRVTQLGIYDVMNKTVLFPSIMR